MRCASEKTRNRPESSTLSKRSVHSWSFRASLTRNLTMRLRSAALRRAAAMGSSRKSKPVTAWPRAAKNRACSHGATARLENRADDLFGGGLKRRLGLADVPGRAAGVGAAKGFAVVGQDVVREKISLSSFLKRHAHTIGVHRAELFRAPGLGLQWTIRVHFSPAFLVFGIQGLNALDGDSHHRLVSDLARQFFVAHTRYVQVGLAAVDSCVVRWRGVTKGFLEATDLRPPIQGFRGVGSRNNRYCAFDDRVHDRRITEFHPGRLHPCRSRLFEIAA